MMFTFCSMSALLLFLYAIYAFLMPLYWLWARSTQQKTGKTGLAALIHILLAATVGALYCPLLFQLGSTLALSLSLVMSLLGSIYGAIWYPLLRPGRRLDTTGLE